MADYSDAIRHLERALALGLRTVSIEGTTHTYASEAELRRSLAYFRLRDDATIAAGKQRKPFNRTSLF